MYYKYPKCGKWSEDIETSSELPRISCGDSFQETFTKLQLLEEKLIKEIEKLEKTLKDNPKKQGIFENITE